MKPGVLVSLCLTGVGCRYDGRDNGVNLRALEARCALIPVCPEQLGGLPTPRVPAEIVHGVVINKEGVNVDKEYRLGAQAALEIARRENIDLAILQPRSPSCGSREVYDGTFSGRKIPGQGVTAALLEKSGFRVLGADEL